MSDRNIEWPRRRLPKRLPAGVLFDMDGLLLDSERLARDAFVLACRDFGWEPDLDVYHQCIGSTYASTREILIRAFGLNFPYDDIDVRWNEHYHARLAQAPVPLKQGVESLLGFLEQIEMPMALVTSTRRDTAQLKLERTGLLKFFDFLVCGGEAERGKPDPDPYLAAASKLDLDPVRCWAIEDSVNGVRSAHAAGCVVLQIPDLVAPTKETCRLAHAVEDSLQVVLQLLEKRHETENC